MGWIGETHAPVRVRSNLHEVEVLACEDLMNEDQKRRWALIRKAWPKVRIAETVARKLLDELEVATRPVERDWGVCQPGGESRT